MQINNSLNSLVKQGLNQKQNNANNEVGQKEVKLTSVNKNTKLQAAGNDVIEIYLSLAERNRGVALMTQKGYVVVDEVIQGGNYYVRYHKKEETNGITRGGNNVGNIESLAQQVANNNKAGLALQSSQTLLSQVTPLKTQNISAKSNLAVNKTASLNVKQATLLNAKQINATVVNLKR